MKQLLSVIVIAVLFTACNSGAEKAAAEQAAKQKTIDSLNTIVSRQKLIDSMKLVKANNEKSVTHVVERTTMVNTSAQPAKKKKKWSNTAKGAVIGAGAGAIAGALIDKKHGEGALVGSLIGAGTGAGTGLVIDKTKKKKKKQPVQQN